MGLEEYGGFKIEIQGCHPPSGIILLIFGFVTFRLFSQEVENGLK